MSAEYIRKAYNMPHLKRGLEVSYKGKKGKITSFPCSYLRIKLTDGTTLYNVHPTDDNLKINFIS